MPSDGVYIDDHLFNKEQLQHTFIPTTVSTQTTTIKHFCSSTQQQSQQQQWMLCDDTNTFQQKERGPDNYGPARQVFASPFLIVLPSTNDEYYLRVAKYVFCRLVFSCCEFCC